MVKTNSLAVKLTRDFPKLHFETGDDFYWSPSRKTVFLGSLQSSHDAITALHETAHALLSHKHFARDIDLLKIEREAWEYAARELAPRYSLVIDPEFIEDMLDTYRDWLHARSTCPNCSLTGVQTAESLYRCVGCGNEWRVNDARRCGLRRYSTLRS
jgi:hypothetical protein